MHNHCDIAGYNISMVRPQTHHKLKNDCNATATMQGNYNGNAPFLISPLEGLQKIGATVTYAQGCDVGCTSDSGFADAVNAAKAADAVVVIIGLDLSQERCVCIHTFSPLPNLCRHIFFHFLLQLKNKCCLVLCGL